MTFHTALVPAALVLLVFPIAERPVRFDAASGGRTARASAPSGEPASARQSPPRAARDDASDAEIVEALGAIQTVDGYQALADAVELHEDVLAADRVVALVDEELQDPSLAGERRGLLVLLRELSLDCRRRGGETAARLMGVRLIAGSILAADRPEEAAEMLDKFAALAPVMDDALIQDALASPAGTWPGPLGPLLEQLAVDWREHGSLEAVTRLAANRPAGPPTAPSAVPVRADVLTGHWRSTRILFEQPQDEHLLLRADGTAETWIRTASGTNPSRRGRWASGDHSLTVAWEDGSQWRQPFTFHDGQLVFPNVANSRQFWERVE
jgi:hypothetical protein